MLGATYGGWKKDWTVNLRRLLCWRIQEATGLPCARSAAILGTCSSSQCRVASLRQLGMPLCATFSKEGDSTSLEPYRRWYIDWYSSLVYGMKVGSAGAGTELNVSQHAVRQFIPQRALHCLEAMQTLLPLHHHVRLIMH
jgi:hypothetical protein